MKRSSILMVGLASMLALTGILAGCSPATTNPPPATTNAPPPQVPALTGTLKVFATDAPPKQQVTSIMVTLSKLEVHRSTALPTGTTPPPTTTETTPPTTTETTPPPTTEDGGEWLPITLQDSSKTFDLIKLKGVEEMLSSASLPQGTYTQVRLTVEKVDVGLDNAAPKPATVPSGVLKIVRPFEIVGGQETSLTMDFDADKSVNVTGQGKIIVKPVIKLTVKPPAGKTAPVMSVGLTQQIAQDFVRNGATFAFDGIQSTLNFTGTVGLTSPVGIQFTFEFDCSHEGYGDRTGQQLAQTVTHHVEIVKVVDGNVTEATIDGKWDELANRDIQTQ